MVQDNTKNNIKKCFIKSLLILVVGQFIALSVFNFSKSELILDYDSSLEIRHAVEMWKNKTLFLNDWNYMSTLEIDTAPFFAAPIYILTSDLSFSLGLAHTFFGLIFILVILDIYKNLNSDLLEGCFAVLLVFTPYTIAVSNNNLYYNNMLFVLGGQYEFRVLTVLLLLDVIVCPKRLKRFFITGVYLIFLFWTSLSCGNYVLLMGVLPIGLMILLEQLWNQKINIFDFKMKLMALSFTVALIGILIKNYSVAGSSFRNNLDLISADRLINNLENCFVGIFLLIQSFSESGISIFSIDGIICLIKMVLVSLSLGFPVLILTKFKHIRNNVIIKYSLIIMAVNLIVLCITDTTYGSYIFEARYHILWFVVILVCLPIMLSEMVKSLNNNYILRAYICVTILCIMILNLYGFIKSFSIQNPYYDKSKKIIEYAEDNEIDTILLYNDSVVTNIVRALNTSLNCYSINEIEKEMYSLDLLDFYTNINTDIERNTKNVLLISDENFQTLSDDIKVSYTLVGSINDTSIYYSDLFLWKL